MKKVVSILLLLVPFYALPYLTKAEWERIKAEKQVSAELQAKLDAFFEQHPDVKRCFVDPGMKFVTPIDGPSPDSSKPEFMARMAQEGYRICTEDPNFFEYQTTPNRNFPGTYDPAVHESLEEFPITKTIHCETTSNVRGKVAPHVAERNRVLAERQAILEAAGLPNLSRSGNITFVVEEADSVVKGSSRRWTTQPPQEVTRVVNADLWQNYFKEQACPHVKTPQTRLYHIPGQPYSMNPANWVAVEERIVKPLTWREMLEEAVKPRRQPVFDELEKVLALTGKNPVWNDLVCFERAVSGAIAQVTKLDLLMQRENDELYAYLVDTEAPSLAGAYVDEKRSAEFTAQQPVLYGPGYPGSMSWYEFMAAAAALKQERTIS